MRSVFVVPCKFDPERPVVFDCVASIREHHPDADVLVVDSDSADRTYFDRVEALGANVMDIGNRRYTLGAYGWAWRALPGGWDRWYLLHDSVVLNAPLPGSWGTVRWFGHPPHGWGWDEQGRPLEEWGHKALAEVGLACPQTYRGILGPMWWCDAGFMRRLAGLGFFDIDVTTKCENSAMERVAGIVFAHLGADVTGALQGEHRGHFDLYDESVITKRYLDRP